MRRKNYSIFKAIRKNDIRLLSRLLKDPLQMQKHNSYGYTPLSYAVGFNNIDVISMISKNVSYINVVNQKEQYTALHTAVLHNYLEAAKILVECKIDVNAKNSYGETALFLAVLYGNPDMIRYLAQQNPNFSTKPYYRDQSALSALVYRTNSDLIKILLNPFDHIDEKFFIYHSETGHKAHLSDILIAKRQLLDLKNYKGDTPLHSAAEMGRIDLIEIILTITQEEQKYQKNLFGYTAFHVAVKNGHLQAVKFLLSNNCLNDKNNQGDTPVLTAFKNNHQEVLAFLLDQDIKIEEIDGQGNNLLHYAVQDGSVELIKSILRKISEVKKQGESIVASKGSCETTAFHYAVIRNDPEIIALLLGSLNRAPNFSILNFAAEFGHKDILKYLFRNKIFSLLEQSWVLPLPKLTECNQSNVSAILKANFICFYRKKDNPNNANEISIEANTTFSLTSYSLNEKKSKIADFFLEKLMLYCKTAENFSDKNKDDESIKDFSPVFFSSSAKLPSSKLLIR